MSAASTVPYGETLKDFRNKLGISQVALATGTNKDPYYVLRLEAENILDPTFFPRILHFLQKTRVIQLLVQSVQGAADAGSSTEELEKLIDPLMPLLEHPKVAEIFRWRVTGLEGAVKHTLTKSLQSGANISEKEASDCLKEYPSPIRSHYPHTMPDHGAHLVAEGKWGEKHSDRLITLKEAAALYPNEVSYGDVLRWHFSGRLEEKGRRWLARPGGRSIPLVSQEQLAYLKDHRPPVGKPAKSSRRANLRTNQ